MEMLIQLFAAQASSTSNPLKLLPGLLTLAPIWTIAERTALLGTSLVDSLVLAPGVNLQSLANDLHKGEYPACAALTSGYVFRIENPATVYFLQRISRTGSLTELRILDRYAHVRDRSAGNGVLSTLSPIAAIACGVYAASQLYLIRDGWGLGFLGSLLVVRASNYLELHRRSRPGWAGASEPGVQGDLFALLSQDRWVRIRGAVDDLKALISGTWLSERTVLEKFRGAVGKLLMYMNVAIAGLATDVGTVTLVSMLLVNSGLLALDMLRPAKLVMHGREMIVEGRRSYARRRDLADQLIQESGRDDWAVAMGLIVNNTVASNDGGVQVIM